MAFTHAILLDLEATCSESGRFQPQEIIEFPSVLLSLDTLEPVDEPAPAAQAEATPEDGSS